MFWRVGIARNAVFYVFFHSFVASRTRKGRSEKRGGAEDRRPKISTKFAPRLRARAIRKSKSLKAGMFGALLEVELRKNCTTPARENDSEVKIVKTLEVESPFCVAAGISRRCKIRGRRRSSWGLQKRWQAWWIWRGSETMRFAWQAQGFRALWCRCLKPPTQNPWKGWKFHVTEVLLCSDHFAWQLQDFVCLGSTFSWQAQYFWSIHLKIVQTYWNSEVKCLVNLPFLKEVSQKCFDFDLQSWSLAQKLRFWASKLRFWRKSRTKASFLIFKASFLKEVSHKSFVFELQSFVFEGSVAQKLRFWSSKLHFWRKSRRIASFLIFKASILKEVSQKSFVFDLQSFVFEGSLAEKLRLTKSFESHISWQPSHLNLKSFDIQITWISNQLTTNSFESQIDRQPNHLNLRSTDNRITWMSNQLTTTPLEVQINRQPKSFEAHIDWHPNFWISNQLTTKSIESQINWQPKSFESQIRWQPNHLTLNSFESDINWLSNQLNSAHSLPIGSLSLETSATALCGRYVI